MLNQFTPCGNDNRHDIWVSAPVGTTKEFIDFYQEDEEVTQEDIDYYTEDFNDVYGNETRKFYLLSILQYKSIRSIFLGHKLIFSYDTQTNLSHFSFSYASFFFTWLAHAVENSVHLVKDGGYQEFVIDKLPYRHRTGIISYADWWKLHPQQKEAYFQCVGEENVEKFAKYVSEADKHGLPKAKRFHEASASWYFHCCAIAYHATGATQVLPDDGAHMTDVELYNKFADGRDEGLTKIDLESPQALSNWYESRERGGHPWEILRGGNSTHISLYLQKCESPASYVLILQGDSYSRSAEVIQIYNALRDAGEPVMLYHADRLLGRLDGTALIGIVPEGVAPVYCDGMFHNHTIVDAVNLSRDEEEAVGQVALWFREESPKRNGRFAAYADCASQIDAPSGHSSLS
jgi:hypothetical protein